MKLFRKSIQETPAAPAVPISNDCELPELSQLLAAGNLDVLVTGASGFRFRGAITAASHRELRLGKKTLLFRSHLVSIQLPDALHTEPKALPYGQKHEEKKAPTPMPRIAHAPLPEALPDFAEWLSQKRPVEVLLTDTRIVKGPLLAANDAWILVGKNLIP